MERAADIDVRQLPHRALATARSIHAIQQAAYTQEAELLGARDFPPLRRTIADLQASSECFFGAFVDGVLAGTASAEEHGKPGELLLASLTVDPPYQRRGIARALLTAVLAHSTHETMVVATGERNLPALALYQAFGFAVAERRTVGAEELPIVVLRLERKVPVE